MLFLQLAGFVSLFAASGSGVFFARRIDSAILATLAGWAAAFVGEAFLIFFLGWVFT